MKIAGVFDDNINQIYTVELEEDVFVDIKCCETFCYIMSCEDGCTTYDHNGNTFDYHYDKRSVIRFVNKNRLVKR